MKISVITPTYERSSYLQGTYHLLTQQTYTHWEWLVYDTSLRASSFSDPRVTYIHDQENVSIGEKRNRLKELASGDVIVHFDDDDYYGPLYLQTILNYLKQSPFLTLRSWFSYDCKSSQLYYWDSEYEGDFHYQVHPLSGSRIREVELGMHLKHQADQFNEKARKGYGFTFAYMKEIAAHCFFPDCDLGEDRSFYDAAEQRGYPMGSWVDQEGTVVHVIHHTNTSGDYPQYRIPHFLVSQRFVNFFTYLSRYHEKN